MDHTPEETPKSRFDALLTRLPLLWMALAILAGILLADWITLPAATWLALAAIFLLLAVGARLLLPRVMTPAARLPAAVLFALSLGLFLAFGGAARYQVSEPDFGPEEIAWYNDRDEDVVVTGMVAAPPDVRDTYTNLRVRVSEVDAGEGDQEAGGLLLVRSYDEETYQYGEIIRLRGEVVTPPENEEFSYRDYLARQGIHSLMEWGTVTRLPYDRGGNLLLRWIYDFKGHALEKVRAIFPDPEGSLLAGILLGDDNGLPDDLQQAFRNTGTAHIIAISGFNVAIIAGLFMLLFGRLLGPRRGPWAAMIGIALYTLLVGADAPVVRAAIMGGVGIFAREIGRRQTALNTLSFTAAVMCLINPFIPWDVGFQLSFFATLGIILYARPFEEWAARKLSRLTLPARAEKIARLLGAIVLVTLAAQLMIVPVMAWHFRSIALISLLANPFILPVQPAVMVLGGLALLASLAYQPLGQLLAWAAWPFAAYTIRMVELFNRLPYGLIILDDFSFLFILAFYGILLLWTFDEGRIRQALRSAAAPSVILGGLGVLSLMVFRAAYAAPDGRLHITFLEVGSAEVVLIETPTGRHILVNGGPSPSVLSSGLGERLSPFGRDLDWLVIASPLEEQTAALPRTLERFPVQNVLWAGNPQASDASLRVDELLAENGTPVVRAQAGTTIDLGYGGRLEVLSATTRGAVLLVEWGEFRALLPIGLNFDALEELGQGEKVGAVDVLLLADSGRSTLNPEEWLANLAPQVFILSVAADDSSGLPDASVLDLTAGRSLLRTDLNGWIEVSTDGRDLQVEVERR